MVLISFGSDWTCRYLQFGLESGKSIILEREEALSEGQKILNNHAIAKDRSFDVPNFKPENTSPTQITSILLL